MEKDAWGSDVGFVIVWLLFPGVFASRHKVAAFDRPSRPTSTTSLTSIHLCSTLRQTCFMTRHFNCRLAAFVHSSTYTQCLKAHHYMLSLCVMPHWGRMRGKLCCCVCASLMDKCSTQSLRLPLTVTVSDKWQASQSRPMWSMLQIPERVTSLYFTFLRSLMSLWWHVAAVHLWWYIFCLR